MSNYLLFQMRRLAVVQRASRAGVLVAACCIAASNAAAQGVAGWTVAASAGQAFPTGASAGTFGPGVSISAGLAHRVAQSPIATRFEAGLTRLSFAGETNHAQIASFGAGATWDLGVVVYGAHMYAIGGGDLYRLAIGRAAHSTTELGLDAGLGWRWGIEHAVVFLEARYRPIATDQGSLHFVPVVAGVRF